MNCLLLSMMMALGRPNQHIMMAGSNVGQGFSFDTLGEAINNNENDYFLCPTDKKRSHYIHPPLR